MKIAIAAEENKIESEVCPTAGRSPYYLLFDGDELVESIKNPFAVGGGGAGFSVARMFANKDVELVIAGKFGGNMESALENKNVKHKQVTGKTVKQALEKLQ